MQRVALPFDAVLTLTGGGLLPGEPFPTVALAHALDDRPVLCAAGSVTTFPSGDRLAYLLSPRTGEFSIPTNALSLVLPESSALLCRALARHAGLRLCGEEVPRWRQERGREYGLTCRGWRDYYVYWSSTLQGTRGRYMPPVEVRDTEEDPYRHERHALALASLWEARIVRIREARGLPPDPEGWAEYAHADHPVAALQEDETAHGLPLWEVRAFEVAP